jgi:molecular chaperone GrpE
MQNPADTVNDGADHSQTGQHDLVQVGADGCESAASEAAAPESALDVVTRERDEYYDRLLRKTAEFDNYRKRTERERREQAEYAAIDLLADLLPIVDDLERALEADTGSADAYRKGVELIHRQLLDLLRRRGVAAIEAVGQQFDPRWHQAVVHEEAPGHAEGEIVEEFRRGYTLRDRLLRPAMVKVAKA